MEARTLGDYRLLEIIGEREGEIVWRAEQASVGRTVRLVELRDASRREGFLADIRAKAAVDHPLIASVYEAVDDGVCFAAFEALGGTSLGDRLRASEAMRPADLAHILRRTAEAMLQLQANGCAGRRLTPDDIYFDQHGVVRVWNLVRAGEAAPDDARADVALLGETLPPLVADSLPGASRMLTVLAWMRGEGIDTPLGWEAVRSYGEQIENQLRETKFAPAPPRTQAAPPKSRRPLVLAIVGGLLLVGGVGAILSNKKAPAGPPPEPTLPDPVLIEAGPHPTPDGGSEMLPGFRMGACEVTIGEYLKFLQVLDRLDPGERDVFDLEGQPEEKAGHEPDDWPSMLVAAKEQCTWRGRPIGLFYPIVNIDWWDAAAYCNWKGCRLPTQEEWFAALRDGTAEPARLRPAGWGPVTAIGVEDVTANGLHGMAGSVAEWTRRPAINPANPLGAKQFVIIGGSHRRSGSGALAREWTNDRLQRRPDLGFRVVSAAE